MKGTLETIKDVSGTIKRVKALANKYKVHPKTRDLAMRIIMDVPSKQYAEEEKKIAEWLFKNIRYGMDVKDVETLQSPILTLIKYKRGDCDCHTIAGLSLLWSIGHEAEPLTISTRKDKKFHHILIVTRYYIFDTSEDTRIHPIKDLKADLMRAYPGLTRYKVWKGK